MKTLIISLCLAMVLAISLGGCALGSASAAYAMRAKTAEELSPEAEDRIVEKIKADLKLWMKAEMAKE